ncbi:hypothetical protein CW731_11280 [Polaribacter sp. ALD11]|uniref:hypothetical protein n=1 Tax=Polaribacter sp. ALD11 TaxID=2058137 RepID=UPI000C30CC4B|nr:hypothetical protein [Polaribacter sp. ALD11]AUC85834.1 hypothetical protein CW731_11280 [Polaribacter sp. ALD11]
MKFIYAFIFTLFFISCNNNNNNDSSKDTIADKWNVTEIIGGFSQPKSYKKETFTWEFDMVNKTVTIVNTSDVFTTLAAPSFTNNQGGVYSFEILEENNSKFLIVDDRKGTIYFTEKDLKIDYGIAFDDIAYIFKR